MPELGQDDTYTVPMALSGRLRVTFWKWFLSLFSNYFVLLSYFYEVQLANGYSVPDSMLPLNVKESKIMF